MGLEEERKEKSREMGKEEKEEESMEKERKSPADGNKSRVRKCVICCVRK